MNALTESGNGFLTDFLIRMFGEVDINSKYSVLCGALLKREVNISVNSISQTIIFPWTFFKSSSFGSILNRYYYIDPIISAKRKDENAYRRAFQIRWPCLRARTILKLCLRWELSFVFMHYYHCAKRDFVLFWTSASMSAMCMWCQ